MTETLHPPRPRAATSTSAEKLARVELRKSGPSTPDMSAVSLPDAIRNHPQVYATPDGKALASASSLASISNIGSEEVSARRQQDFEKLFRHQLISHISREAFPSESPELDAEGHPPDYFTVVATQSCDLQAKILLHGRLYLTPYHLCFRSNILGVVTEKIHPLRDIIAVEKGTTAKWIQNAIYVKMSCGDDPKDLTGYDTVNKHYGYGSLADRDKLHEQIVCNWKVVAPERYKAYVEELKMNGEYLGSVEEERNGGGGSSGSGSGSGSDGGSDVEDETNTARQSKEESRVTECSGQGHLKELALDTKLLIPLNEAFELLYRNAEFAKNFYEVEKKLSDVKIGEWEKVNGNEKRTMTYVMPINNPIGPSQSDCIGQEIVTVNDPEKSYEIDTETRTPGVPSGNSFYVHARICLTHAESKGRPATRLYSTSQVEWTGGSWLKGAITPAVIKGQKQHFRELVTAAKSWIKAHPDQFTSATATANGNGTDREGTVGELTDLDDEEVSNEQVRLNKELDEDSSSPKGSTLIPRSRVQERSMIEYAAEIPNNPVMLVITIWWALRLLLDLWSWNR